MKIVLYINCGRCLVTKRHIACWHGRDKKLVEKIESFCEAEYDCIKERNEYYWSGSLDEFERLHSAVFLVYPEEICVTQFSSFNQR